MVRIVDRYLTPFTLFDCFVLKLSSEKQSPVFCQRQGRMNRQELFLLASVTFRVQFPQMVFKNKSSLSH